MTTLLTLLLLSGFLCGGSPAAGDPSVQDQTAASPETAPPPQIPSATLVGQVMAAEDGRPISGATVEVIDASRIVPAVEASHSGRDVGPIESVQTDERGWYRFSGLAPKPVYLRVTSPGRPPVFGPRIELEEGRQKVLESMEVALASGLEILIAPGPGVPQSDPLLVSVIPSEGGGVAFRSSQRERVAPGDAARFTDLAPGRWKIAVATPPREDGMVTTLAEKEVELPPGGTVQEVIDLPVPRRLGRVLHLEEPVEAELQFLPDSPGASESGFGGALEGASAGPDGSFPVPPRLRGRYLVRIQAGHLDVWLAAVEIEDSDEPLVLRVPGGRIQGTLVDSLREPVAGALVLAQGQGARDRLSLFANARTDKDGIFVLEGLAAGRWQVEARVGKQSTRAHLETVGEDEEVTGVELRLEPSRVIAGRVVSATGEPVLDAYCHLEVISAPQDRFPAKEIFFTDEDGRFEIRLLPDSGVEGVLAVYAFGHPVTSLRLPVTGELTVVLPAEGGRIEISGPADPPNFLLNHLGFLYLQDAQGGVVSLGELYGIQEDVTLSEATLTLDNLAPGSWRLLYLVPGQNASLALLSHGKLKTVELGRVSSRPGRTSRLELARQ